MNITEIIGTSALKREIIHIDATKAKESVKIRVAGYARVSRDSDDQLNSFYAQIKHYKKVIENNQNYELVEVYADEGITGVSTENRQEFNRMIEDCKDGKIDRIITKSTSRFSRNTLDSIAVIRELKGMGVTVLFEKEGIDTEVLTSENIFTLYSLFAQEESISISKNVKKGKRVQMAKGEYSLSNPAYGYKLENKQLVVNEEEAQIVRRIFSEYLSGNGTREISRNLSIENIPTKTGKERWERRSVSYILKNEKYIGDMLLQKKYNEDVLPYKQNINRGVLQQYYVKDTHEAIIDRLQFELVKILLENKYAKVQYGEYLLSRKIKCKECGTLYGRKLGNNKIYWVCRQHDEDKNTCGSERLLEEKIYQAFIRMYNKLRKNYKLILNPMLDVMYKLQELEQRENLELREISEKISKLSEQNHKMSEMLSKGILDSAIFISKSNEFKRKLTEEKKKKAIILSKLIKDNILEETENLIECLEENAEYIYEINTSIFNEVIKEIRAKDKNTIEFVLVNDLVMTERLS
ncbi:MAG: recombinase family protein [Clostridia bacterium]